MNKKLPLILAIVVIVLFFAFLGLIRFNSQSGSKNCSTDSDCVVFGKDGDCNCGCYNKDHLPWFQSPIIPWWGCDCAAPDTCECVNGKCQRKMVQIY